MKETDLINFWKQEENAAHIHGWDFSHIDGRYTEETDLPWDYRAIILNYLKPDMRLLDVDTGGGETLLPLGIDFRAGNGKGHLPFNDAEFNMIINRHGDFNAQEIHRVLKDGGIFITEQVGAENDRELVELLLGTVELPFPGQYLNIIRKQFCFAF